MTQTLTKKIVEDKLRQEFGENILNVYEPYGMLTIEVSNDKIGEIIKYLKEDEELEFTFLTDLCGMHYESTDQLGVVYLMHQLPQNIQIRLKTFMPKSNPETQSLTHLFSAANWLERETYDFFGIIFKGHPDLRRIMNVDEMDYFPLRKEYPLEDLTRTDKDDSMFGREGNYDIKLN